MAGPAVNPNDIAKARESGYSDAEIASYLADKSPEQFKQARDAGYTDTEILAHLSPAEQKPSGVVAGLRQGISDLVAGPAETLKTYAGVDTSRAAEAAKALAPKDYKRGAVIPEDGHWYNPGSWNWNNVPQAIAEQAPALGEGIIATKAGAKIHPLVGLAAGVGVGAFNALGPTAKRDAVNRTGDENAVPNSDDKSRAGLTVAAQSIPQAVGLSRFLPGAGKVTAVGGKGAAQGVGQAAITTGVEGASGAAQDVIGQVGATVGTPGGVKIDPNQVAKSGVVNGLTGAGFATPKMLANAQASRKYAKFGGDNETATNAMADRIKDAADGSSLSSTKDGFNAVRQATENVQAELKTVTKSLANQSVETAAALKAATKGRTLTDGQLAEIDANTPPDVAALARQAHVGSMLKETGDFSGGKFAGGVTNSVAKHIRAYANPIGAGASAALGAATGGGHAASLFAYSPQTLAALATAYAGMRGVDALTGSRSPAKGFVDRFSGQGSPQPTAPLTPPQPGQSVPQVAPPGPTPPPVQPWGPAPASAPPGPWGQRPHNPTGPQVAPPAPAAPPPMSPAAMNEQVKSALLMYGARRKAAEKEAAANAPEPLDAKGINEQIKAALLMSSVRRKIAGQRQAEEEASQSEAINEQGGLGTLGNPEFAKRGSELLKAASVMQKLRATTPEEAPPEQPTPPPVDAAPTPTAPDAPTAMTPPQAPELPVAPTPAPVVTKITKKTNGAVKEKSREPDRMDADERFDPETGEIIRTSHEEANAGPKYTGDYVPLESHELYGQGWDHTRFAEHELSTNKDKVGNEEAFKSGIERDRQKRERTLQELSRLSETPDDTPALQALLEQLHHIRRGDVASKAVRHYASFISPKLRAATVKRLDKSWLNSIWSK